LKKNFSEKRKRAKMDKKEREEIFSKSLICFVTISKVHKNYGFIFNLNKRRREGIIIKVYEHLLK
jgi:hypothetical protein